VDGKIGDVLGERGMDAANVGFKTAHDWAMGREKEGSLFENASGMT
jgi:hypothetical protein